ncbi:undecaprenyl-phosphate glucose phosphotransferase [Pedobacter sp.]|uniref:undecaprenyl-phosphate glucose phosphotransferase n=1 Tax=Pedobacter sp. TaxID=1411316 RepID=UPI003D7F83B7
MQNRYVFLFCLSVAFADFAILYLAIVMSFSISSPLKSSLIHTDFNIIVIMLWFFCSKILSLYDVKTIEKKEFFLTTIKCIFYHLIFLILYLSFTGGLLGNFLFIFYMTLSLLVFTFRLCISNVISLLNKKFNMTSPIFLMGVNPTSLQFADVLKNNSAFYKFVGFLTNNNLLLDSNQPDTDQIMRDQMKFAAETGIKEVYVSLTPDKTGAIKTLINEAHKNCIRLKFIPDYSQIIGKHQSIRHSGDLQMISLTGTGPQDKISDRFVKRVFDIVFSSMVILFVLSWLYPLIAILIKMESPGPVLFKQGRSGKNNVSFMCFKFRSMRVNSEANVKQASRNDSRITKIGRFLRRTSLDEMPQFFNVLFGDMSVVGPRPHMLEHTAHYRELVENYMVRHYIKPGITGWAQVNGYRGETQHLDLMENRIRYDIYYLENWSIYFDLKIIFRTIFHVVRGNMNAF